jgi:hypothetical protein
MLLLPPCCIAEGAAAHLTALPLLKYMHKHAASGALHILLLVLQNVRQ